MKRTHLTLGITAMVLTCMSVAEAQSEYVPSFDVDAPAAEEAVAEEPVEPTEPAEPATEVTQDEPPPQAAPEETEAQPPTSPQVHLRFRSIRIYAGAGLQMASVDAPSTFETLCQLPCNVDIDAGVYHLSVRREDGREYVLPASIDFSADARISLKYGASTGAWVGGILALTGVLGVLIGGGIAIAGAANDNSGQTNGGLVGLGLSSALFGAGLATFLLSERGLRAEVLDSN